MTKNSSTPVPTFLSVQPEAKKFFKAFRYLGDVIVSCRFNKKTIMDNNFRPPHPPLRPYFLSVQPEVNKLVTAFRYLGDVIVACRVNKENKKISKIIYGAPPPPPRRPDLFATGNKYIC